MDKSFSRVRFARGGGGVCVTTPLVLAGILIESSKLKQNKTATLGM